MSVTIVPPVFDLSHCIPDLKSRRRDSALAEMAAAAVQAGFASHDALLLELLKLRERIGTTAIGKGVAIPQARSLTVSQPRIVMARAPRGVDWGAEDGIPVQLVLMVLAPAEWPDEAYHGLVARAVNGARLQRTRHKLLSAGSLGDLSTVLREALA